MDTKHCGKRRNCSLRAISPFPAVFSKDLYCRHVKTKACLGKGLIFCRLGFTTQQKCTLIQIEAICRQKCWGFSLIGKTRKLYWEGENAVS